MQESFSGKLLKSLGLTAIALAPSAAGASVVHVSDRPVVLSMTTPLIASVAWDVDGDGTTEFTLKQSRRSYPVGSRSFYSGSMSLTSAGPVNGRGIVGAIPIFSPSSFHTIQPVAQSGVVGPTLSRGYWGGPGATRRLLIDFGYDSLHPPTPSFRPSSHFLLDIENDNLIAFSFDPGDGLHYGWARLSLNADFFASEVTISEWAYNDEQGQSIHVGSVPAPPAAVAGLTLLGLGAAGLRAQRQRKRAAA